MYPAHAQYNQVQFGTSSKEKILVMLYDGAIRFTKIAIQKIEEKNISGKGVYIGKAVAIVAEMQATLNMEMCEEVTKELDRLYSYLIRQYTAANRTSTTKPLQDALRVLGVLREAWVEAIASLPNKSVASGAR